MAKNNKLNISERIVLLRIFDILFMLLGVFIASLIFDFHYFNIFNDKSVIWFITLTFYLMLFGQIFELYNLKVSSDYFLVVRSILLTASVITVVYIFSPFISPELPKNRLQIIYLFFAIAIPILIWRFLYILLIFAPKFYKNVLVIGNNESIYKLVDKISMKETGANLIGYVSEKKIDKFKELNYINIIDFELNDFINNNDVSEIVISSYVNLLNKEMNNELIKLFEKGISVYSVSSYYEKITACLSDAIYKEQFYLQFNVSDNLDNRVYLAIVRFIDIIVSVVGVVIMICIIPFILIVNLVGNRGSLFYSQVRVGKKDKRFRIYKFRSMIKNSEEHGAVWAKPKDNRITPFGKFLRRSRIDELPQFLNILKGNMNLIGPRPERPEFVKELSKQNPLYSLRHLVKPGLTGWAQVIYPYASTFKDQEIKLRYDLYYIKHRSFLLDFKIFIKTLSSVLFLRGQ